MRRIINPLNMIAVAMELNRVVVNDDIPISEQTQRDLVDDKRFNLLKCILLCHVPPSPHTDLQLRQLSLFLNFYLPRQKNRIDPPISIPAYLKTVVCNRLILTQTDSGHSFQWDATFFSEVLHERIGASLC